MPRIHVKKDDQVYVLSGKDRARTGKVIAVMPKKGKVVVEGVNIVTKHQKPTQQFQQGGIAEREAAIDASNVMLVCPKCNKPSKTGTKVKDNGERYRYCKSCDEDINRLGPKKD